MSNKTHWKQLVNPDYIGAYALPDGNDITVTIDFVRLEKVKGPGGKEDECTVAHLVNAKPLILNVTNSKTIHKLYGPYIEDWRGKQITLFASTTKMGGEIVECIRIRPAIPTQQKPVIAEARFNKALQAVKNGGYTAEKLRDGFALTDEQERKLTEALRETA
jgi:hypothetical protein